MQPRPRTSHTHRRLALCLFLSARLAASLAASLGVSTPCLGADTQRPGIGEAYIFNAAPQQPQKGAPGALLEQAIAARRLSPQEFLDPGSRAWAGAAGIRLTQERASVLLERGVIAYAGNAVAAAAAKTNGSIEILGSATCPNLAMPQDHPAFALALADSGSVLAAWAQGARELVTFDLRSPGCPMTVRKEPLLGETSITLSPSGAFIAAHDSGGAIWVGPADGELRRIASLEGQPAAIAFSESEGVLLVLDRGGHGGIWSTRTGRALRGLSIAGGPFARGELAQEEARLWTADGRLVRYDVLRQRPVDEAQDPLPTSRPAMKNGWLELRGADLHLVGAERGWGAEPVYEPHAPSLDWSAKAGCLRVRDVDGAVRYYSAATGAPGPQCLADDWASVPVDATGRARVGTLELRLFDVVQGTSGDSKIYCRMLSETQGYLWTDAPAGSEIRARIPNERTGAASQSVAVQPQPGANQLPAQPLELPYRQGLAAGAAVRRVPLK